MAQLTLGVTGPTKAALVEGGYDYCGLNGFDFDRTPDEMVTGLRHLNAMMAEWLADGIDLGFDFPTYSQGLLEEPSGVPDSAVAAIHGMLAQRLAPGMGATLSPAASAALSRSYFSLRSRYAAAPPSMVPATILPSSGVRHSRYLWVNPDTTTTG